MKKVIILSAAFMLGVAAYAQDTIPTINKKSLNNLDTTLNKSKGILMDKMKNVDSTLSEGQQNLGKDSLSKNITTDTSNTTATTVDSKLNGAVDSAAAVVLTDRVMMKEEAMYLVKDGESTLLDKSYKLESGAVISTTGNVKFPSGKVVQLKNGQFIELKPVEKTTDSKTSTTPKKIPAKKKPIRKN